MILSGFVALGTFADASPVKRIGRGCEHRLQLRVDTAFTLDERADIVEAARRWNKASSGAICFTLSLARVDDTAERSRYRHDGVATVYSGRVAWQRHEAVRETGDIEFGNDILAYTVWEESPQQKRGVPLSADIFVFRRGRERFLTLVTHEIGHLLGLAHSPNPSDLMASPPSAHVDGISQEDRRVLQCLLRHGQLRLQHSVDCQHYVPPLFERAMRASLAGKHGDAARWARKIVAQHPEDSAATHLLALSACRIGDRDTARWANRHLGKHAAESVRRFCGDRGVPLR